tara:strand:- start:2 stop:1549 length:1548 start_codon:yes stop_codon:yes gene_type:complete
MKIRSVCILGGGSAGFSAAAVLARYRQLSEEKLDIKLIHSEKIGSIGVGESTVRNVNQFLEYIGLEDKDWMKKCNATYKTAIKFTDFNKGSYFYYPFGTVAPHLNNFNALKAWSIQKEFYPEVCTPENIATYFVPHAMVAEKNKLTDDGKGSTSLGGYDLKANTAYHFNANKLGKTLKEYAENLGVEVVDDTFIEAKLNEDGSIKSLVCEEGTYEADLFVDCSGFESLLLGQTLNEEFISFSDTLINNKALVAKIPYTDKENQLKNYTDCVALKNGWCWEIPLWDGLSVGYVHTNKFATEEEIEKEFFDRYGEVEYRTVEYKTGRHQRGWVKNVVAIGLSYGFIEPLESTGLASTFINCMGLLEGISKRNSKYTEIDRELFNKTVGNYGIDTWRSMIEMHYFLSKRDDSDYWNYVTQDIDYKNDIDSEYSFERFVVRCGSKVGPSNGYDPIFIVGGMEYPLYTPGMFVADEIKDPNNYVPEEVSLKDYQKVVYHLESHVSSLPSTFEFTKDTIYS